MNAIIKKVSINILMRFIRNIFNSRIPASSTIQALAALMLRVASFTNWFNAGGMNR